MLQKLRRTVAVACLIASAVFVVMWMRSARHWDTVDVESPPIGRLTIHIFDVGLYCTYRDIGAAVYNGITMSEPAEKTSVTCHTQLSAHAVRWNYLPALHFDEPVGFMLPHWFLASSAAIIGAGLLIQRPLRFSLRTLAIAATLLALALGLGVAASRLTLG